MNVEVRVANPHAHVLAESPFWDAPRRRLLWVDIERGEVFAGGIDAQGAIEIVERIAVEGRAGAVAAASDGSLVIAANGSLLERPEGGSPREWVGILSPELSRRLNDGKPDPRGRYVVGTLALEGTSDTEQLFVIDDQGRAEVMDNDLSQANGLAWSPDGGQLYTVDTLRRRILSRPYDPVSGRWGARSPLVRTAGNGYPDGLCVDAEGYLWVAMWGAGEVRRYSPAGQLVDVIAVPAPHTSSVAFAGPLLDTLVITTATHDLTPAELTRYPDSGKLFTCSPGVLGAPQSLWNGSTTPARPTRPELSGPRAAPLPARGTQ